MRNLFLSILLLLVIESIKAVDINDIPIPQLDDIGVNSLVWFLFGWLLKFSTTGSDAEFATATDISTIFNSILAIDSSNNIYQYELATGTWLDTGNNAKKIVGTITGDNINIGTDDEAYATLPVLGSVQLGDGTQTFIEIASNVYLKIAAIEETTNALLYFDIAATDYSVETWSTITFNPATLPQKISIDSYGRIWVVDDQNDVYYGLDNDFVEYTVLGDVTFKDVSIGADGSKWFIIEDTAGTD